jgi:hypothetical protein
MEFIADKLKVQLSLCFFYLISTHEGVLGNGGEWSASRPGRFILGKGSLTYVG